MIDSIAVFMAYVLKSVNEISKNYLVNEKRYNYTTPKSYLELIALYIRLLREKTDDHCKRIQRLENGLIRLAQCSHQVDSLKVSFTIHVIVLAVSLSVVYFGEIRSCGEIGVHAGGGIEVSSTIFRHMGADGAQWGTRKLHLGCKREG